MSMLDDLITGVDGRLLLLVERARSRARRFARPTVNGAAPPAPTPAPAQATPAPPPRHVRRHRPAAPPAPPSIRRYMANGASAFGQRLDSMFNALSGMGGSNDKGAAAMPDISRTPLELIYLDVLYRFSAYGRRVVDIVANDSTRKGWTVTDDSQQASPLAEEEKRLDVVGRFNQGLKNARHMGGCCVLIIVDEEPEVGPLAATRPEQLLARPLDPARVRRVRNLIVLDRYEATPAEYEPDVESERFGEPSMWTVSPGTAGLVRAGSKPLGGGFSVHWTRILYLPGRELPRRMRQQNAGYDDSVLEACWDAIRNMGSVDQGGASLLQELKLNVMRIAGLAGLSTSDQAVAFAARMQQIALAKSMHNMIVLDEKETFDTLATPLTGFEHLDANARRALSAAAEIPETILFGVAPGGLGENGESAKRDWANVIASYQATRLYRHLLYLYRLLYAQTEGPTRGVAPEKWDIEFNPLDELTEKEEADVRKVVAETDAIYVTNGILPPEHVAKSRFGPDGWTPDMLPYDAEAAVLAEEAEAQARAREAAIAGEGEIDPATGQPVVAAPVESAAA